MNRKYIYLLACPKTGEDLILSAEEIFPNGNIKTGVLHTVDRRYIYPIKNGIPRFISRTAYTVSFSDEWSYWPRVQFEADNIGKPMSGHTTKMFKSITHWDRDKILKKKIIEFGCGTGRFIDLLKDDAELVVGLEMSDAVDEAQKIFHNQENVLLIQGDILKPPFKEAIFDLGYTIGVLHHTPDPEMGLINLSRTIKKGGEIASSVYSQVGFYNYPVLKAYRLLYKSVKKIFGYLPARWLALIYSHFSGNILYYFEMLLMRIPRIGNKLVNMMNKYLFVCILLPDYRWRVLDIFDAITPKYASTHQPSEIRKWFNQAGIKTVIKTDWADTSFLGKK